ncbi:DUF4604 domain-containing protein [Azospirillum sp. Sh1]|uniref:DUF4604 domain-containing protein n=1 Tax=Azospirillum sp. Sh1 TaxID=2607285 RepID=UPI0011EBB5D3|nr:DUF4604 domain-containing protein [Azospirillum sp. Sh1]KAA0571110.1 hypothetical protein FZ029_28055 [Azospirillum sp. Sh1]
MSSLPRFPGERLTAFQAKVAQIEAQGLPPSERRRALEKLRDESGVTSLNFRPWTLPADAVRSDEEVRERRRKANANRRRRTEQAA